MISLLDNLGSNEKTILLEAAALVHKAALMGVILEIERTPLKPLAMGNHEATISVWPARNVEAERERQWRAEGDLRLAAKLGTLRTFQQIPDFIDARPLESIQPRYLPVRVTPPDPYIGPERRAVPPVGGA